MSEQFYLRIEAPNVGPSIDNPGYRMSLIRSPYGYPRTVSDEVDRKIFIQETRKINDLDLLDQIEVI